MTAAPGPQQPDEDPDWVYNETNGWLFGPDPDNPRLRYPFLYDADPDQCRTLAAYLNDTRPAAPSAQPDERCSVCLTPAQPVRDTGEGRR